MGASINFNEKKGFICDMDGVIYHGNRILPGVAEFIQWLHEEDKEYLFLTNNSGYTPRELNQKLARMGLDVPEEHFYTQRARHGGLPAGAGTGLLGVCHRRGGACSTPSTTRASR